MRVKNINSVLPISYLEGLNEEMVMSVVNTAEQAGVCIACRQYQATIHNEMCWDCMVNAHGDPGDHSDSDDI